MIQGDNRMKQMKLIAAMFGLIALVSTTVLAKDVSGSVDNQTKTMAAAMDSLTQTISNGSSEDIAGASDAILAKAANFSRSDDASVVSAGDFSSAAQPAAQPQATLLASDKG